MKIQSVEAFPIDLVDPTSRLVSYAHLPTRQNVVVKVTADGIAGWGEAQPIPYRWGCSESQETVLAVIRRRLAPLLAGREVSTPRETRRALLREGGNFPYAIAAVVDAMIDLYARSLGVPANHLLGGPARRELEGSWSVSFHDSDDELQATVRDLVDRGFSWIKIKVGRGVERDVSAVTAAREAAGSDVRLHVDANGAYAIGDAVRLLRRLEPLDVAYAEQPIAGWNLAELAELRRRVGIPIMADESVTSATDLIEIIRQGAADAVYLKTAKNGGVLGARQLADIAEAAGLPVMAGGHVCTSLGVAAAAAVYSTVTGPLLPGDFHLGTSTLNQDLTSTRARVEGGVFHVGDGVGFGVDVNDEMLAALAPAWKELG